jgi:hypothetical protein
LGYSTLISVDALFRLEKIKEELEDQNTIGRIRAILVPQEFTRVDGIIDLVFNATKEVKSEEIEEVRRVRQRASARGLHLCQYNFAMPV